VIQWRVVLADITEKKAAETILAESEARFRELFTGAPIAYHSLDAEGNVVAVNDRWLSALGYTRKEVLGKSIAEFMSPTYREQYRERFTRGKTVSDILGGEIVLRKKDDTEILAAVEGRIGRDARGGFSQTHSVFHDITAQRKAEKDRRRLEEQLRQAQKMAAMGTLAGGIAHEFNNILSIIVGNTELIADEIPLRQYSPVSDYLGEIRAAGLRARDMVRQLLVFSRQDDAHKVPVGFGAVVKEALKMLRTSLPAQIGIELTVADDVAPVKANATQISQVLINLCRNAADAMPVGEGAIFIDVGNEEMSADVAGHHGLTPGRWVKMAIRDNGRGMDAGTLERIFEPYFTTKAVGEGSGIGLSVVHGIVADHGGAISAHSEPGKGTVFTLRFPAHHGKIPQRRVEPVAPPTGTGRILIVDDEPSLLKLGRKLLERVGYAVTSTTDPADALALVAADPAAVDLVVTDLAMPQMSGERLATEIHKIAPDTPIILCTGFSRQSVGSLSLETGIRAVVMKPYDRAELATAVKKALDDARGEEKH
jgi:PAS domain S-box-containing protein